MDKIRKINSVSEYNAYWGLPDRHPYVNVLEGSQISRPIPNCRKNIDLYVIFIKDVKCANYITYGRNEYDFQANTLASTTVNFALARKPIKTFLSTSRNCSMVTSLPISLSASALLPWHGAPSSYICRLTISETSSRRRRVSLPSNRFKEKR